VKRNILFLTSTILLSLVAARAGDTTNTSDSKDKKMIVPAEAAKGGLYIGIFGGVNLSQSGDPKEINVSDARPRGVGSPALIKYYEEDKTKFYRPAKPVGIPNGAPVHSPTFTSDYDAAKIGELGGLKLGYELPKIGIFTPALELEGSYNTLNTSGTMKSNHVITGLRDYDNDGDEAEDRGEPFSNPDAVVAPTRVNAHFNDNIQSGVFMLNGIIKADLGRVRPYIGGGVGLAYVSHNYSTSILHITKLDYKADPIYGQVQLLPTSHSARAIENAPQGMFAFGDDNETTFAWQALAGLDFVVTKNISIFTEYRALFLLDGPYYRNFLSNTVSAGVRYNF
jgi:opacity protein-like surface antigen